MAENDESKDQAPPADESAREENFGEARGEDAKSDVERAIEEEGEALRQNADSFEEGEAARAAGEQEFIDRRRRAEADGELLMPMRRPPQEGGFRGDLPQAVAEVLAGFAQMASPEIPKGARAEVPYEVYRQQAEAEAYNEALKIRQENEGKPARFLINGVLCDSFGVAVKE